MCNGAYKDSSNQWFQAKDLEIKASLNTCDVSVTMIHEAGCFQDNYGIYARTLRNNYLVSGGAHLFLGAKVLQSDFAMAMGFVGAYVFPCIVLGLVPFFGMFYTLIAAYFTVCFWIPPVFILWTKQPCKLAEFIKIGSERGMGIMSGFYLGFTFHSAIIYLFEYQSFWLLLAMCFLPALILGLFAKHTNDQINLMGKCFIGANFIGRGIAFFMKENPSEFEVFATLFNKQEVDIGLYWDHLFVVLLFFVTVFLLQVKKKTECKDKKD